MCQKPRTNDTVGVIFLGLPVIACNHAFTGLIAIVETVARR
jgi:hypothetical protein